MRRTSILAISIFSSQLCACGDDGVVASASSGSSGSSGSTGGTGTTAVEPTSGEPPTTGGSSSGTGGASQTGSTGESSTGESSTGESSTGGSSTGGSSSTGGTTDGESTTTGETGDTSAGTSSTGESTETGEDTGGPLEGLGYVGMSNDDSLVIFDPATQMKVAGPISMLPEADYPYDATIEPGGAEVWIVGAAGDGVKVVETATGQVSQQIDLVGVGEYPVDVLFSVDGATAYVSSRDSEAVVILDAATYTVTGSIPMPAPMWGGKMTLDPCTGDIYMVDWYDKSLLRVDPVAMTATPKLLGTSLWDLRIDPTGSTLYVTDRGLDVVHVVDVATLDATTSVPVGDDPWGIDITSDGGLVVVACEDDSSVHFIDTGTLTATSLDLPAGADPRDVEISLDDARAYVPTGDVAGNDGVYEIDLVNQVVAATIDLGANANSNVVAISPQAVECAP
jgi:YVTN family beta-propeller protein